MTFKDCSISITINQGDGHPRANSHTQCRPAHAYPSSVPPYSSMYSWPPCSSVKISFNISAGTWKHYPPVHLTVTVAP